ncbi:putative amino acid permease YhdG [Anoxybacillus sp. BCO1]|nr:putative amino acid permease YhdG [Anoxybacillus sp. BCO1]
MAGFISLGAITGITTVLLVMLYAQTRLFYAISRDGLLPSLFAKVSERKQVPLVNSWVTGIAVSIFAGVIPLNKLAHLTNIGTLFAFTTVAIGILILRKTEPNLKRKLYGAVCACHSASCGSVLYVFSASASSDDVVKLWRLACGRSRHLLLVRPQT